MKHALLSASLLVVAAASAYAQNTFPSSGNVGIGTTSPTVRKLQLYETGSNVSAGIMVESAGTAGFENADIVLKTTGRLWQISNGKVNPANGLAIVDATAGAARLAIDTSGNVGIGTAAPGKLLDVAGTIRAYTDGFGGKITFGNGNATDLLASQAADGSASLSFNLWNGTTNFTTLFLKGSGNVGIGTTTPSAKLEVRGDIRAYRDGADSINSQIYFSNSANTRAWNWQLTATGESAYWGYDGSSWIETIRVKSNGNVGIGTTNPAQKLAVNGTIRAKEVIVDTGWSDYVFRTDYRLASLSEVEGAIQKDGHLPGIPSASDVAEHGISVGEMQARLLAKIEELTLHLIRIEKENAELRDRVHRLESTK